MRLKAFCAKISDSKQKLAERISNAGKERTSHKKSCKENVVSLGWVHFNESKNKYCVVYMSKGGGARQHYFPNKASAEDVLNVMKLTFFPNESSSLGKLCDMRIRLGNFQQQVLDVERFTLSDYIRDKVVFAIKGKVSLTKIRDLCTENLLKDDDDDDDDNDDDFELDFVSSPSSNSATSTGSKTV